MKMMQGACFFACSNMSRTRDAPTPTNISTKSEPEMVKNGTLASPAMARARRVLPVPGEPTMSTPFGILPPSFWNLPGSFKKSTISTTSCLASFTPRHVGEGNVDLVLTQKPRAALSKGHGSPATGCALHLAHEIRPEANENQYREGGYQQLQEHRLLLRGLAAEFNPLR